jgi:hypothetical protein
MWSKERLIQEFTVLRKQIEKWEDKNSITESSRAMVHHEIEMTDGFIRIIISEGRLIHKEHDECMKLMYDMYCLHVEHWLKLKKTLW